MSDMLRIIAWVLAVPAVSSLVVLAVARMGDARARRRDMFARAFAACRAYREFPYAVRRRGTADPEGERLRISSELRQVQQELAFCLGWVKTESDTVARAYSELVASTRTTAGGEIKKAWESEPVSSDREMSVSIDLTGIDAAEAFFLAAVRRDLSVFRRLRPSR